MRIKRIDHIGINVDDLPAAKAFFLDCGLEVTGEMAMEDARLDRIVALPGARTSVVMLRTPDGGANIELIKYHAPPAAEAGRPAPANAHGLRHLAFEVDDLEALVAKLAARGTEFFSPIETFAGSYKLCYCRGPEGIILELAEAVGG